ncbi:hypothetical protein F4775DRAFT_553361 [Biscogniauxia sp. FL1348]|nr:hypothetical protein F4775DRAFT_553361 [Biscogniauxia sp. FL1348]
MSTASKYFMVGSAHRSRPSRALTRDARWLVCNAAPWWRVLAIECPRLVKKARLRWRTSISQRPDFEIVDPDSVDRCRFCGDPCGVKVDDQGNGPHEVVNHSNRVDDLQLGSLHLTHDTRTENLSCCLPFSASIGGEEERGDDVGRGKGSCTADPPRNSSTVFVALLMQNAICIHFVS